MAVFNNRKYTKEELLRHVGSLEQLAGIRKTVISEGKADGIRMLELTNGGGLELGIQESKCLDILDLKYKGTNLRFLAKTGPVDARFADNRGVNYLRSISGGFMYTCGLSNVGKEFTDSSARHPNHGRIRFIPAEKTSCRAFWDNDEYLLEISGEIRDSGLFNDNLVMRRKISTAFGSKAFTLQDEVENEGFSPSPVMLMYHMNLGFPLIDKGTEFFAAEQGVLPIYEASEREKESRFEIPAPIDGYNETAYLYTSRPDDNGLAHAGVYNHSLRLGICISYDTQNLPYLLEWKSMRSGDYAFGIMPTNNHIMGREKEEELGSLRYIRPFEKLKYNISVRIIDGDDEYAEIKKLL